MSDTIRPLEPADVAAAVALFERVVATGSSTAGLERLYRAILFEDPWTDPDLPSLVSVDTDGRLAGLFTRCTRRFTLDGEPLRVGCAIHFAVAPEARGRAAGVLLAARLLSSRRGAQMTHGANAVTERVWSSLHGWRAPLESLEWTRTLRPGAYWVGRALERSGRAARLAPTARRVGRHLDRSARRVAGVRARPAERPLDDAPLTPEAMVERLDSLAGWARLRPAYDVPWLEWLFAQLGRSASGSLHARMVLRAGEPIGWHVSTIVPGGTAHALQLLARPGAEADVFDAFADHARSAEAVAVSGRLEAPMLGAITRDRSVLRSSEPVLLRTPDDAVADALRRGEAVLTRLDMNAWMDVHGR